MASYFDTRKRGTGGGGVMALLSYLAQQDAAKTANERQVKQDERQVGLDKTNAEQAAATIAAAMAQQEAAKSVREKNAFELAQAQKGVARQENARKAVPLFAENKDWQDLSLMYPELGKKRFEQLPPEAQRIASSVAKGLPDLTDADFAAAYNENVDARFGKPLPTAPAGMSPSKITYGDKGPEATFEPTPTPFKLPENSDLELQGLSVGADGKPTARFGRPEETRAKLAGEELNRVAAVKQAKRDLDTIEQLFQSVDADKTGPIVGRVRGLVKPYDQQAQLIEQAIGAATPNLARGVFREVGVLTDADVKRYSQQFPSMTDTPEIRAAKLTALRQRLGEAEKEMLTTYKEGGRAMGDLKVPTDGPAVVPPGQPAQAPKKFQSLEEFSASGLPAGTKALVYDPVSGNFRPATMQ